MSTLTHPLRHISGKDSTTDALEDHEGTVSIAGRAITKLLIADDITGFAGAEQLSILVERLDKSSTAYGMEISADKITSTTNNTSGVNRNQSKWTEA